MSKSYRLLGLIGALSLVGILLLTVPQGALVAFNPLAEVTAVATPLQIVVEALTANLRAEPATDAKLIGMVRRGTRLTVIGAAYNSGQIWYLVQLEDDAQAWISDAIVHVAGNAELVPTINLTVFFAPTATHTQTPTPTATATMTFTPTPTNTPTHTPTRTPSPTSTFTATSTATATNTATATTRPTLTATRIPPTNTPKPKPTNTLTPTKTLPPSFTERPRPTSTPKPKPTNTRTPTKTPSPTPTR